MAKIKLAIAGDNQEFRKGIIKLIHLENDFAVTLEAENGLQLLEQLKIETADIILMHIEMPVMDGIEATIRIKALYPDVKIIAFSQNDWEDKIIKMCIHGVMSIVSKEDGIEELIKAIPIVNDGGVYMTDRAAGIIQKFICSKTFISAPPYLNEFEQFLLSAICKGQSSTQIGRLTNKSYRTIEEHREKLYKKFGVRSKEELLREAYKRNIIAD